MTALWGLAPLPGRRRKPDPTVVVHLVFADLTESVLAPDSPLARSIGQVADALSARPPRLQDAPVPPDGTEAP